MIALLIASIIITPGKIGEFYEIPTGMPAAPECEYVLGNDDSYENATTIDVPAGGRIYCNDVIVTNVPMPTVRLDTETDTFKYVFTNSKQYQDEELLTYTAEVIPHAIEIMWRTRKFWWNEGVAVQSNYLYRARITSWVSRSYATPHYALSSSRHSSEEDDNYAALVAICEANKERLYSASLGDWPTNVAKWVGPIVTNKTVTLTNIYTRITDTYRIVTTNTTIVGTHTNKTVNVTTSNVVQTVTNIVDVRRGPFLSRRFTKEQFEELSEARENTRDRIYCGVARGEVKDQLVDIPGSILGDPAWSWDDWDGVLHWWSSTQFDSCLLPGNGFTWEQFKPDDTDYLAKFDGCGLNFGSFKNKNDTSSYENSNPLTPLVRLAQTDSDYDDLVMPVSNSNEMFKAMMTYFPRCLQSRGTPGIQDDEDATWWDYLSRRHIGMVAAGMNQLLALQDITIHIPHFNYTSVNRCGYLEMNQKWKTRPGTFASVWWNNSKGKMEGGPIGASEFEESLYVTTNDWSSYQRPHVEVSAETTYSRSARIGGVDQLGSAFILSTDTVRAFADFFVDPSKRINTIQYDLKDIDKTHNPVTFKVVFGGLFEYGPFEVDVSGPFQIDVGGSASVDAVQICEYTTNAIPVIGATQPNRNLMDRVEKVRLGALSFAKFKYEVNNVTVNTGELIRANCTMVGESPRENFIQNTAGWIADISTKLESLYPPGIYKDGIIPRFSAPPLPPGDNVSVDLNVYGRGSVVLVDYGTENENIFVVKYSAGVSHTNELPTPISFVDAQYKYETTGDFDVYHKTKFEGKGNLHPITQTDWKWKAIKAEEN